MRQLGADPGELAALADRVAGGDFEVDDGAQHRGVLDNLLKMVAMLKKNIEAAQRTVRGRAGGIQKRPGRLWRKRRRPVQEAHAQRNAILAAADRLEGVINVVSSASEELSAQIEQCGHGAAQQAARVTETATAMEEMNSTVAGSGPKRGQRGRHFRLHPPESRRGRSRGPQRGDQHTGGAGPVRATEAGYGRPAGACPVHQSHHERDFGHCGSNQFAGFERGH